MDVRDRFEAHLSHNGVLTAYCIWCPRAARLDIARLLLAGFVGLTGRIRVWCLRCGNEGQITMTPGPGTSGVAWHPAPPYVPPDVAILRAGIGWVPACAWPLVPAWVHETTTRWEHDAVCGRFAFYSPHEATRQLFGYRNTPNLEPRYNVAPTQPVAVVRAAGDGRELSLLRWGLIPFWAKEAKIGATMINARAETVMQKPGFRSAFQSRRCLVLADGYYEWRTERGKKQPYYFSMKSGQPFAFAGLWERNDKAPGGPFETCCIITTAPNSPQASIHDRTPAILAPEAISTWLSDTMQPADLFACIRSFDPEQMQVRPVSVLVNAPKNDVPECIATA